jgi:HEAT repeat protein
MKAFLLFGILTFLFTASSAQAKSIKKMTESELVEVVQSNPRISKRIDAINALGKKGKAHSQKVLANRCHEDPNPEICTRVVAVLEQINTDSANAQLLRIVQQSAAPLVDRKRALFHLVAKDKARIRDAIPGLLQSYRTLPETLGADLVTALITLNHSDLADLTVLIAKDPSANRTIRVSALAAAEYFKPPRLWSVWLSLLDDPDSRLRAHCALKLGNSDLPSSLVEPALRKVLRQDVEGNVRAAAANSLSYYAHPGLLPDLHNAVIKERHPIAWKASLDLLLPLSNNSSVPSLVEMLGRDRAERTKTEVLEVIVRKLAHIGNSTVIQYIYAVEQNRQGTQFAQVCRGAVKSLKAEDLDREIALQRLKKDVEVSLQSWDKSIPDPVFPPLNVALSPEGTVVY